VAYRRSLRYTLNGLTITLVGNNIRTFILPPHPPTIPAASNQQAGDSLTSSTLQISLASCILCPSMWYCEHFNYIRRSRLVVNCDPRYSSPALRQARAFSHQFALWNYQSMVTSLHTYMGLHTPIVTADFIILGFLKE
jgi:hypothetical protein